MLYFSQVVYLKHRRKSEQYPKESELYELWRYLQELILKAQKIWHQGKIQLRHYKYTIYYSMRQCYIKYDLEALWFGTSELIWLPYCLGIDLLTDTCFHLPIL